MSQKNYKQEYEFKISKINEGFEVFVIFVYIHENGDKSVAVGGDITLNINKSGKVYNVQRGR